MPLQRRQVDGGGDHVVGRLAHVHRVIGMDRGLAAPAPAETAHWRCPAITSLVFMFVEVPLPVWKTSSTNWSSSLPSATACAARTIGARQLGVEQAQVHVHLRRGLLDEAHGPDELARETEIADLEVPRRALRLGPVISLGRDLHLAHRIAFRPGRGQSNILHGPGAKLNRQPHAGGRAQLAGSERPSMTGIILSRTPRSDTRRSLG